jgi:DNA-directed RNA polymerase specialized sigma24 family protein
MQPPTKSSSERRETAGVLYRRHHRELQQAVAAAVRAPRELIEDACQTAWAIMLRAEPDCRSVFGWLRAVAIHEAYRLVAIERYQTAHASVTERIDGLGLVTGHESLQDSVEALEALRHLASLPERQRNDLALKIAGYSYKEIQARTPGRTMTNINKSLAKARARIRRWGPE